MRLLHLQQEAGWFPWGIVPVSFRGTDFPSEHSPGSCPASREPGTPAPGPTEAYLFNAVGIFGQLEGESGLLGYYPLMRHQICTTDRSCYNACVSNISTPLGFFPCGKQRNTPHSVTIWRLSLNRPSCCVGLGINAVVFLAAFSCSFTDTAREKEKTCCTRT